MNYNHLLRSDSIRYGNSKIPNIQRWFRRAQCSKNRFIGFIWKRIYLKKASKLSVELYPETKIGEGLYLGHYHSITINPKVVIGRNCNIHGGVLIGQENRGNRKGTPVIGDNVWIGINVAIVGNVHIGNDVLIAPNSYINCDVPDHSVVFGNPCIIKHKNNATEGYINNTIMSEF